MPIQVDEEFGWSPFLPQQQAVPWFALTFAEDEAIRGGNFVLEQEKPWSAQFQAVSWVGGATLSTSWGIEEEVANAGGLDEVPAFVAQVESVPWWPFVFVDSDEQLAILPLDQEEGWTAQFQAVPWTARYVTDDEAMAYLVVTEDEAWVPYLQPFVWTARPFLDDEAMAYIHVTEDEAYTAQLQSVPWVAIAFTDDEAGTFIALDEDLLWTAQTQLVPWTARYVTDDDLLAQLRIDDEAGFVAQFQGVPWNATPFAFEEETPFCWLDDQAWVTFPVESVPWVAMAFTDDEAAPLLSVDEDLAYIPAVPWPQWVSRVFAFEEDYPPTLATGLVFSGPTSGTQYDPVTLFLAPTGGTLGQTLTVSLSDNTGATFTPTTLTILQGTASGATTAFVYIPNIAGVTTLTEVDGLFASATFAYTVNTYDSVHHRLMLAVKQVILNLRLKDIPQAGQGIPDQQIIDQFKLPDGENAPGLPGISINLRGCTVTYEDLTFNYSTTLLPAVELVGFYVSRPMQVDILDSTDKDWRQRYPLWLLWIEKLMRAFLQPNIVPLIQGGVNGAVATVPEVENLEVVPDAIVDSERHKAQEYKTGLKLIFKCSECGT